MSTENNSENAAGVEESNRSDKITGDANDNYITGLAGAHNVLDGGARNDTLVGDGRDILIGGTGADTLKGGRGDDVFEYFSGDGADTIVQDGFDAGSTDTLAFQDTLSKDRLWLQRGGGDLAVYEIGGRGADKVVIQDWFAAGATPGGRPDRHWRRTRP